MRHKRWGYVVLVVGLVGCDAMMMGSGSNPGGGNGASSGPVNHVLVTDQYQEFPAAQFFDQEFDLPSAATVTFSITNRSTTDPDHWDVGVFSDSEFSYFASGRPSKAYGLQENVSTMTGSAQVPQAGRYHLGMKCRNVFENCMFSFTLTTRY